MILTQAEYNIVIASDKGNKKSSKKSSVEKGVPTIDIFVKTLNGVNIPFKITQETELG